MSRSNIILVTAVRVQDSQITASAQTYIEVTSRYQYRDA